jgi:hypothetical protein
MRQINELTRAPQILSSPQKQEEPEVGGYISIAEAEEIVFDMMTPIPDSKRKKPTRSSKNSESS